MISSPINSRDSWPLEYGDPFGEAVELHKGRSDTSNLCLHKPITPNGMPTPSYSSEIDRSRSNPLNLMHAVNKLTLVQKHVACQSTCLGKLCRVLPRSADDSRLSVEWCCLDTRPGLRASQRSQRLSIRLTKRSNFSCGWIGTAHPESPITGNLEKNRKNLSPHGEAASGVPDVRYQGSRRLLETPKNAAEG